MKKTKKEIKVRIEASARAARLILWAMEDAVALEKMKCDIMGREPLDFYKDTDRFSKKLRIVLDSENKAFDSDYIEIKLGV